MNENEKIVREACHVLWTEGQADRAGEFYADDYVADYVHDKEAWGQGVEGVKNYVRAVHNAFPDYKEEIVDCVAAGDKVAVKLEISGTHQGEYGGLPATGRPVSFREIMIITMRDGKIIKQDGQGDNLSVLMQLGVIEMPQAV